MPTINVSRQADATGVVSSNFNTARTSNAASFTDGTTDNNFFVQYFSSSGRGGGTKRFKRAFLHFDTSGITGTLSAAHIDINGGTSDIVRVVGYCMQSTQGQIWFNPDNTWVEIA